MTSLRQKGFTLVEMVVTIVILAIALAGVAAMVSLGTSNSADTMLETRAIALAQSYLDEIMGRRFDERSAASGLNPCYDLPPGGGRRCTAIASLGPDGGESSRDLFDDVDDYNGLEEGDGVVATVPPLLSTVLLDAEGLARSGYENFNVSVTVRYAGTDPVLGLNATDAKLITVTVKYRGMAEGWNFSVYKGNY